MLNLKNTSIKSIIYEIHKLSSAYSAMQIIYGKYFHVILSNSNIRPNNRRLNYCILNPLLFHRPRNNAFR